MNKIPYSASFVPFSTPSLNHIANPTHHLATILTTSYHPYPSLNHSTNLDCAKGPMSEKIKREVMLFLSFLAFFKHGQRQMCSQSVTPYRADPENWHITSSSLWSLWRRHLWSTIHHTYTLDPINTKKGESLIQSLVLQFWYLFSRTCSLFQSVQCMDISSSITILLYLLVTCKRH